MPPRARLDAYPDPDTVRLIQAIVWRLSRDEVDRLVRQLWHDYPMASHEALAGLSHVHTKGGIHS